jgi:hypothetical protein
LNLRRDFGTASVNQANAPELLHGSRHLHYESPVKQGRTTAGLKGDAADESEQHHSILVNLLAIEQMS